MTGPGGFRNECTDLPHQIPARPQQEDERVSPTRSSSQLQPGVLSPITRRDLIHYSDMSGLETQMREMQSRMDIISREMSGYMPPPAYSGLN